MDSFGFVILTGLCTAILHMYLAVNVGRARRKHGVPLPDQYSDTKKEFNCYQRAYMNTVENIPIFLMLLFAAGNKFPLISAGAGMIWIAGRVLYAHGYYTGDPEKRMRGAISYIGLLTLLVCTLLNAVTRIGFLSNFFDWLDSYITLIVSEQFKMGGKLSLPKGDPFGYVILTGACSVVLHAYLSVKVGMARRKHKIPLPDQYSADCVEFNCYQRAYMNMVEMYPVFLFVLFAGGDKYPRVSAAAGMVWIAGRIAYAHGYYTGDPSKRNLGGFGVFGLLTLLGCTVANGVSRLGITSC
ncbi:PREDICTED: uncharacterized protein LOC100632748 [Amphimedon queenslandica]|uniref:Glutathione S-transferase 3, mitochondrial n=3 Tax=Amphimedon queenslandica TaxID=400682 RepID=A0AAN0IDX1_AMPQE|nr:PREDICTED: uncharacterized protein LOC100632748 [Amphimedon queenslandica]|eukprot:XP_003386237.2 PREDICTED: uncharacterized protein LOC100632748 [Amphimedon queenslandica]